jgi:hypothetical protein
MGIPSRKFADQSQISKCEILAKAEELLQDGRSLDRKSNPEFPNTSV